MSLPSISFKKQNIDYFKIIQEEFNLSDAKMKEFKDSLIAHEYGHEIIEELYLLTVLVNDNRNASKDNLFPIYSIINKLQDYNSPIIPFIEGNLDYSYEDFLKDNTYVECWTINHIVEVYNYVFDKDVVVHKFFKGELYTFLSALQGEDVIRDFSMRDCGFKTRALKNEWNSFPKPYPYCVHVNVPIKYI